MKVKEYKHAACEHIVNESNPMEDRLHAEAPLAIQTFDGATWLALPPVFRQWLVDSHQAARGKASKGLHGGSFLENGRKKTKGRMGWGGEGEKEEDERQRHKGPLAKKIEMMGRVFRILGI
jgi:hypothetical protein